MLAIRRGDDVSAYVNACPHVWLPLTFRSPRLLSEDGERLTCSNHLAQFAVDDGRALSGPVEPGCGLDSRSRACRRTRRRRHRRSSMTCARLDDTHDPGAAKLGRVGQRSGDRFPDPEPAVRALPPRRARRAGASASRSATGSSTCERAGLVRDADMNALMAPGDARAARCATRCRRACATAARSAARCEPCLVAQSDVEMGLPCRIGDYTDFYASIHHATTVGRQFRPDNPLLPNYKWVPIGYHGRASSIGVSGHAFRRPNGQTQGARRRRADVRPEPAPRLRARARHRSSARATRSASRSRSTTPRRTCSASCC